MVVKNAPHKNALYYKTRLIDCAASIAEGLLLNARQVAVQIFQLIVYAYTCKRR